MHWFKLIGEIHTHAETIELHGGVMDIQIIMVQIIAMALIIQTGIQMFVMKQGMDVFTPA